jgi:hypothetical protein
MWEQFTRVMNKMKGPLCVKSQWNDRKYPLSSPRKTPPNSKLLQNQADGVL